MTQQEHLQQSQLVHPGDRLLIAISLPEHLSEPLHQDLMLDDFLDSSNWPEWQVEIHSILKQQ